MSSRALRRLQKDNIPVLIHDSGDENSNSEKELNNEDYLLKPRARNKNKKKKEFVGNRFDLLENGNKEDECDEEEKEKDDTQAELTEKSNEVVQKESKIVPQKKKKKKKSKATHGFCKNETTIAQNYEDNIDAEIEEANAILGEFPIQENKVSDKEIAANHARSIFNVEHRHLNPEYELKRLFGSRVIKSELTSRRNRKGRPTPWLSTPKDNWPPYVKTGLSMSLVKTADDGSQQMFTFEHNHQYQEIQFKFYDAVESLNTNTIADILQDHPYHIDSLIQFSEICKNGEDLNRAKELIERALFSFEMSFHPLFSLTKGNCLLDFRRQENRAFYTALFKHIFYLGSKGCNRTALEYCKLLLSLDPDNDPLCVLLFIDYYALRAEEFSFLIRFYEEQEPHKNLSQLPNFAFSVPLAMYHLAIQNNESTEKADKRLQESLRMFPALLFSLLDKCSVNPAGVVTSCHLFTEAQVGLPSGLRQLIGLYTGQTWPCWKVMQNIQWLEKNVEVVVQNYQAENDDKKECYRRFHRRYQGTPRNICRYILLSEIKEAMADLPPDITNSVILSYDILPPRDNIETYKRPQRPRRVSSTSGGVTTFLRSLLPDFSIDEPLEEEHGATGGGHGAQLTNSIETLLEVMRDLMGNIRPVPPPIENPQNQADPPEEHNEEWG
ncbi:transcription factor 25 [Octopus bimaculoides]|uniref:Transcription factor 25 n=1 Tax=Octopus bimaculoides TaxID=37653 RepID=A0A0L8GU14_OCTBM|nr:transcription factor 25 [Octopus bimaculoides]|eukprot:XP_014777953.1 PREDICTED: transcription factor 25-like [Octopus bimaculoides]